MPDSSEDHLALDLDDTNKVCYEAIQETDDIPIPQVLTVNLETFDFAELMRLVAFCSDNDLSQANTDQIDAEMLNPTMNLFIGELISEQRLIISGLTGEISFADLCDALRVKIISTLAMKDADDKKDDTGRFNMAHMKYLEESR